MKKEFESLSGSCNNFVKNMLTLTNKSLEAFYLQDAHLGSVLSRIIPLLMRQM